MVYIDCNSSVDFFPNWFWNNKTMSSASCMNLCVFLWGCVYGCAQCVRGRTSVRSVLWFSLGFALTKLVEWLFWVGGGGCLEKIWEHKLFFSCERLWCGSKADFRFSADAQKWSVPPDSCVGSSCHAFASEVSATQNNFLNGKPAQIFKDTIQY